MDAPHPLNALLQLQLATDASAVLHFQYVIKTLTDVYLAPSPHLPKWTSRINSLLHSKDAGARWVGLCLAHRSSSLSQPLMLEFAQTWVAFALSLLSKNDSTPVMKASIHLLLLLFTSASDMSEYKRSIATPNVPKFTTVLVTLAEKHPDPRLKVLSLTTIAQLIPHHPTLHKASHAQLSTLCNRLLNGSATHTTDPSLLAAASRLYCTMHLTGGKVGAANLWRKAFDETLAFAWGAFSALRTTFSEEAWGAFPPNGANEDRLFRVPLNIDRLHISSVVLSDLLRAKADRPVQVPLGGLVKYITALLNAEEHYQVRGHIDPEIRAMELAALPIIHKNGSVLLISVSQVARQRLLPHISRLATSVIYHLETQSSHPQRLPLLEALVSLFENVGEPNSPTLLSRIAKTLLASVTVILSASSPEDSSTSDPTPGKGKKGKKRARGYEGDEVFKVSRNVIFPTADGGSMCMASLDALMLIMRNPELPTAVYSIAARVMLSVLFVLPQTPPASISTDPTLYQQLLEKVQTICTELATTSTEEINPALGLITGNIASGVVNQVLRNQLELLLHPRLPPLVRAIPDLSSLSLFATEESREEADIRVGLKLQVLPAEQRVNSPPEMTQGSEDQNSITAVPSRKGTENIQPDALTHRLVPHVTPATSHDTTKNADSSDTLQSQAFSSGQVPPLPPQGRPQPKKPLESFATAVLEDADEEMPDIDLDSDSEHEE